MGARGGGRPVRGGPPAAGPLLGEVPGAVGQAEPAERARQLTEQLLAGIRTHRAKVVVIDTTGVPDVDESVANHLVQTVDASRLMGASVIITGLSSKIAQTLVTIGVDLSKMHTIGDLQGGIEEAEHLLGFTVIRRSELAATTVEEG